MMNSFFFTKEQNNGKPKSQWAEEFSFKLDVVAYVIPVPEKEVFKVKASLGYTSRSSLKKQNKINQQKDEIIFKIILAYYIIRYSVAIEGRILSFHLTFDISHYLLNHQNAIKKNCSSSLHTYTACLMNNQADFLMSY